MRKKTAFVHFSANVNLNENVYLCTMVVMYQYGGTMSHDRACSVLYQKLVLY